MNHQVTSRRSGQGETIPPQPEAEFYPEPATPWFCFDPEGGFTYHASPELAEQAAAKKIGDYIDEATQSWRPGVEAICTGLILTHSEQSNVVPVAKHPAESPLDLGAVGTYELINIHRRG